MSLSEFALEDLFRKQLILKDYLQEKVYDEDWHAVSDVANDLRVLEERIKNRTDRIEERRLNDGLQVNKNKRTK